MIRLFVEGIGLRAPGLDGWAGSLPVLRGEQPYAATPTSVPPSPLLPANERRRMVMTVKLALLVGAEAFANAERDPSEAATVFTSSGGDGDTLHGILQSLVAAELDVSPTRFHNSVHNAPSGYWAIATKSHTPTTSICGHDWSFAAGLLDAAAQAASDAQPVGLIAYDLPYPEPLNGKRSIDAIFGTALLFTPTPSAKSFAALSITLERKPIRSTMMEDPGLEALRTGNPAARSLSLLTALARRAEASVVLEHFGGNALAVAVAPLDA